MVGPSLVERLLPPDLSEDAAVALEDLFEVRNRAGKPINCRWLAAFTFYARVIASYQYYRLIDFLTTILTRGADYSDLSVRLTPYSNAVPGDRIVGVLSREGVTIYPVQSPVLKRLKYDPARWIDARWDVDYKVPQRFPTQLAVLVVLAHNLPETQGQITRIVEEHDGTVENILVHLRLPDFAELTIDLGVYNLEQLTSIIVQLRALKAVVEADRLLEGDPFLVAGRIDPQTERYEQAARFVLVSKA